MIVPSHHSDKNLIQEQDPGYLQIVVHPANTGHLIDEAGKHQHKHHHHQHKHHHHMQEDIERYLDMQRLDPDWKFAEKHGQSTRPGRPKETQHRQQCICCLRQIIKEPVGLCQNSKELQFLGYGFPLYFIFMKYVMVILLLEIINYTSIELYWSVVANTDFCIYHIDRKIPPQETIHCTSWMVLLSSISQSTSTDEHIIRLTSFVTLLVVLIYVRDQFTKTWMYYDQRQTTYSDFSILVEKIPSKKVLQDHSLTIGQRLRGFFADEAIFPSKPYIAKINLIGQFQELQDLQHKKKELGHELEQYNIKNRQLKTKIQSNKHLRSSQALEDPQLINSKKEIREKKKNTLKLIDNKKMQIKKQKIRLKQLILKEDLDCDKAIICFEYQDQKDKVLEEFQKSTKEQIIKHFQNDKIKIQSGPQPHQISWENINIERIAQRKRIFISWLIFLSILGAVTVGFYYLLNFKSHQVLTAADAVGQAIDYSSLIAIILFNKFLFAYIIHHLVQFQKHKTGQSAQFHLMLKYSLGLFFTTAVMTILVQGITHDNVYKQHYGIVEQETIMFFFTAFLVPFIWLLNPWYLWKLLQRKLHKDSPFMTQQQANKLMEDPQYLMGKRYGQVLKSIWFTFLYACVIPMGSMLIFIGTGIYYWIDKYNLLRKSSILQGVSGKLCMKALFLLDFVLILKPTGELIFDALIRHTWSVIPVVQISIGAVYILLPMTKILSYLHSQKFLSAEQSYSQLRSRNFLAYELYNPLTKQEELKTHFEKIENCTDDSHEHISKHSMKVEGRGTQRKHSIVRPHTSIKKIAEQFSHSDNMQNSPTHHQPTKKLF